MNGFRGTVLSTFILLLSPLFLWGQRGVGLDPAHAFITRWQCEENQEVRVHLYGTYSYEWAMVDGSGNPIAGTASSGYGSFRKGKPLALHAGAAGEYRLIAGPTGVENMYMYQADASSKSALRLIEQWGRVKWTSVSWGYQDCTNLDFAPNAGIPDLSNLTALSGMFKGCSSLNGSVEGWGVSHVTKMKEIFSGCVQFDQPLASWFPSSIKHHLWIFGKEDIGLSHTALNVENYSATLVSWASKSAELQPKVHVQAQDLLYDESGAAAREVLETEKGWVFHGDGLFEGPTSVDILDMPDRLIVAERLHLRARVNPTRSPQGVAWRIIENSAGAEIVDGVLVAKRAGSVSVEVGTLSKPARMAVATLAVEYALPTGVTITKVSKSMVGGTAQTLEAVVEPLGAAQEVEWQFEGDHGDATLSASGELHANASGTIRVKAICKAAPSLFAIVPIRVTPATIPVSGINLIPTSITLNEGQTAHLVAKVEPVDATNQQVRWRSTEDGVARVDQEGNVVALRKGTAQIEVRTEEGGYVAHCQVEVRSVPIPIASLTLKSLTAGVEKGKTVQLEAMVQPDNATDKELTWSSSSESIATVDATGLVQGVSLGTATITVSTQDGLLSQSCSVEVRAAAIPVSGITLSPESATMHLNESVQLSASVEPLNASNRAVSWVSEDGEIAEVDSEGKVLAVGVGETHVVVTSLDGGFSKRCHVRVNPLVVPIMGLTLAPSVAVIELGKSLQLEAGVQPSTATSVDLVWSSSNESVAGVDQQGKVEGIKPGEAIITVKTAEGSHETFCELSVLDASVTSISVIPLEEVSVNPNPFTTALRVLHASHVQRYEVLNAMGVVLRGGDHAGEAELSLQVGDLAPGVYMLRLHGADGVRVFSMVKR